MNEPKYFTREEGGQWLPWVAGAIDGRALKKRDKSSVEINGIKAHSIQVDDGREWDCINGWRLLPPKVTTRAEAMAEQAVTKALPVLKAEIEADLEASFAAQAYASRVWSGQSDSVPRAERLERVRKALEGQGLSMEGVTL